MRSTYALRSPYAAHTQRAAIRTTYTPHTHNIRTTYGSLSKGGWEAELPLGLGKRPMIGSILSALIFSSPSDPSPSLCQVNPITKEQHNALGTSYRKVPLMMADGVELVESSVIISLLHSHFTTGIKYKRTSYTFLLLSRPWIFWKSTFWTCKVWNQDKTFNVSSCFMRFSEIPQKGPYFITFNKSFTFLQEPQSVSWSRSTPRSTLPRIPAVRGKLFFWILFMHCGITYKL